MLEKVNANARNNKASPKPNVSEIDVLNLNLEYRKIVEINMNITARLIRIVQKKMGLTIFS